MEEIGLVPIACYRGNVLLKLLAVRGGSFRGLSLVGGVKLCLVSHADPAELRKQE